MITTPMWIGGNIAAWFTDVETERFLEASSKALEMFGYTREEFLRLTPADIVAPEEHSKLDEARKNAPKKWGLGQWWTCRRKDGSTFRMQTRYHMQDYRGRYAYCAIVIAVEGLASAAAAGESCQPPEPPQTPTND